VGFLQQFFKSVFEETTSANPEVKTIDQASKQELVRHLNTSRYGDFELTDAVRPALDLKIRPTQGYRHDHYVDEESQTRVPVIMASASKEILFQVFMQLVTRLGNTVDVVLETSHNHESTGHTDLYREQMDLPVLSSMLWEYEDLLTHDGCAGIAVLNPKTPQEIQLDEHKLLIIYGSPLEPFEHILEQNGIHCNEHMHFITEAEHVHSSSDTYMRQFQQLQTELGLDQKR
jgi:hypothetical protein